MAKVAFLGLGVMGYPMAGHLAAAGHEVTVFNRTAAKAESWVAQHGGASAATPAEAAREAEFIFACVGEDDDVRQMTTGENGAFSSMQKEAIFIDNTTASADVVLRFEDRFKNGSNRGQVDEHRPLRVVELVPRCAR